MASDPFHLRAPHGEAHPGNARDPGAPVPGATVLPPPSPHPEDITLLDERLRPDFRDLFGRFCSGALALDVAVGRIRLGGLDLQPDEVEGVRRIRVVLAEVNAARLVAEADAALTDPARRRNVAVLADLFRRGRLELRAAPLAGWAPDFSVFHGSGGPAFALVGPHWFQRPFPHPGPALTSRHGEVGARRLSGRFDELWAGAHDVGPAIREILDGALRRNSGALPFR